jgi:hypothetical protein
MSLISNEAILPILIRKNNYPGMGLLNLGRGGETSPHAGGDLIAASGVNTLFA